ncbi:MAG: excinuclease ABC subunit UvrB [Bacteroidota bacterium]|nr:excinuclease ABC subunit UvrB [Bacteroidota bacterium]MDP4232366.1 excinuclease ABC subunit UvrB [Bacteroidota bacterium]MDP4241503.1 excinuclease ABC subunit UvrB [Bacteroidota bacterium]MDP4288999.1 excinuclease ABC subunit UvrB [Bacteroidota bacterium]
MSAFQLVSDYKPSGDQPRAIAELIEGIKRGDHAQVLLGVTGSGKTFTMSNVIAEMGIPTLIISHNKTLAAQLYGEFKQFFPNNAVEFFISYYDYYQPEAYIPSTDTFIEKDFAVNDEIDRLRLKATSALLDGRSDVIIVASVSCIYGIGSPDEYARQMLRVSIGQQVKRNDLLRALSEIHYSRNDVEFQRGTYRVRGDIVEVIPAYEDEEGYRIEFFGDTIERIVQINRIDGKVLSTEQRATIYPAKHFVTSAPELERAIAAIEQELEDQLALFRKQGKLLEAQRIEQRTRFDLEMLRELGYCSGVENYSRHLSGRKAGERPSTLVDYFPDKFLTIIDESHQTIPQVRGMSAGDRARKEVLVAHGFRLPSAIDNRPLNFGEFQSVLGQVVYVSATPSEYELAEAKGIVVEQIIRPTGLLDPEIQVRPVKNQIDDLLAEIRKRARANERVLVTTLTKRMAEDLTDYYSNVGVKIRYLHSDIDALERVEILRDLRTAEFDVLVGVNLLREGLDLPEVSLIAILDADKEGFLRSERSLMQTAGRTARNSEGLVIFYADKMTKSMQFVIDETERRRAIQHAYNVEHGIIPQTIHKSLEEIIQSTSIADVSKKQEARKHEAQEKRERRQLTPQAVLKHLAPAQLGELIEQMKLEMKVAAREMEFERAADIRDEVQALEKVLATTNQRA